MDRRQALSSVIPVSCKGLRLDSALTQLFPDYSRARMQKWIRQGNVLVDEKVLRCRDVVSGGEHVTLEIELVDEVGLTPQEIELDVVYEDDSILVVNKPAGLIMHPGAGNPSGTLANALLYRYPELQAVPRVGIVHRLDKDTSGLLVVARQLQSHANLVAQLQCGSVGRKYIALVDGEMTTGGTVNAAIGRHPVERTRMAITDTGKPAITHYRVRHRYRACTLLDVRLETGRTHQIRVHMAYLKFPLIGDPVYGKKIKASGNVNAAKLSAFPRQALHAASLSLVHPYDGRPCEWSAPLPSDFQGLLDTLL